MKYLLDTDHVTILQYRSGVEYPVVAARLLQISEDAVAISIISFHEQTSGSNAYINRARGTDSVVQGYERLNRLLKHYAEALVLPFDENAAAEFDRLRARGVRVGTMDLRIASIALARRLIVATRNTRDFSRVPDLVTEDWTSVERAG